MDNELTFGNYRGRSKGKVATKAAADVARGRALVFPITWAKEIVRLRISPVGWWRGRKNSQLSTT